MKKILLLISILIPKFLFAAEVQISDFLNKVNKIIINPLIVLMFTVATVVFLYGIFEFIQNMDNPTEKDRGKRNIGYGLLGMFIMISVFAIMRIILGTFDVPTPEYLPLE